MTKTRLGEAIEVLGGWFEQYPRLLQELDGYSEWLASEIEKRIPFEKPKKERSKKRSAIVRRGNIIKIINKLKEIGLYCDDEGEVTNEGYCFMCGGRANSFGIRANPEQGDSCDAAHILAWSEGGSTEWNNILPLCDSCHRKTEMLSGKEFWLYCLLHSQIVYNYSWWKHPIALADYIKQKGINK